MLFEYLKKQLKIDTDSKSLSYSFDANPMMTYLMSEFLLYLYNDHNIESTVSNIDKDNNFTFRLSHLDLKPIVKQKWISFKNSETNMSLSFKIFSTNIKIVYFKKLDKIILYYTTIQKYDDRKMVVTKTNNLKSNMETLLEFKDNERRITHKKTEWDTLYINDDANTYGFFYSDIISNFEIYFIYDKNKKKIESTNIDFNKIKKSIRIS